jgi:hypothetical protein
MTPLDWFFAGLADFSAGCAIGAAYYASTCAANTRLVTAALVVRLREEDSQR